MNKTDIEKYINDLKKKKNVRVYTPFKYFHGLHTKKEIMNRFDDILRGSKTLSSDKSAYKKFDTDNAPHKKKESRYTTLFRKRWGDGNTSLKQKSDVTGIPIDIIKRVYNKGRAAWRTGHRVGATEQQWGFARVHSFLVLGCTAFSSDFSLLKEAYERMSYRQRTRFFKQKISCPASTLDRPYFKKLGHLEVIRKWIHT